MKKHAPSRAREGGIAIKERTGKENDGYAALLETIDPTRRVTAEKYVAELRFMERQLEKLKQDLETGGAVDDFVQGRQSLTRQSPALKAYCGLVQRYGDLQKKLADLLPEKRETRKAQAGEKLAAFVAKGKG